jgi:hypothetical protein
MPGDDIQLLDVACPATLTVATISAVDLPENAEVAAVTVDLATAPAGSSAIFDVLDGATSIFAGQAGTIRKGTNAQGGSSGTDVAATDTAFTVTPNANGFALESGQVVTIGTEDILLGTVSGSPLTEGANPEYAVSGCTRGVNGTTAAIHTAGTAIFPAKPKVVAGSKTTSGKYVPTPPASRNIPPETAGDSLSVTCTQIGSGTAGGGGSVALELVQR